MFHHSSYVLVLWGVLFFGACSHNVKTVSPTSPEPIVKVLWNEQTRSPNYFGKYSIEHAKPAHSKSKDVLIIASSSGAITAFRAANGDEIWQKKFKESFFAGPLTASSNVYVASVEGYIRALDIRDGNVLWETQLNVTLESSPAYHNGRLFVSDSDNGLFALDALTGEVLWTYRRDPPSYFTIRGSCNPYVDKDVVYCGFTDGQFGAFQIETGELVWSKDLSDGQTEFVDVDEDVFVSRDKIYVASYNGGLFALERQNGDIIWHNKVRGIGDIAQGEETILVATSTKRVASIDKSNGTALWSYKLQKNVPLDLLNVGNYVFVTTAGGPVYILDVFTGYPFQKWIGTHGTSAPPTWGADRLYFFTDKGEVLTSKLAW